MMVVFLATITSAAIVDGIIPPSSIQTIDPTKVSQTPPFDHPGLRKLANGSYEAYYVAHIFSFEPHHLSVPAGARVTFYVTSTDVEHGFSMPDTGINMMVDSGLGEPCRTRSPSPASTFWCVTSTAARAITSWPRDRGASMIAGRPRDARAKTARDRPHLYRDRGDAPARSSALLQGFSRTDFFGEPA